MASYPKSVLDSARAQKVKGAMRYNKTKTLAQLPRLSIIDLEELDNGLAWSLDSGVMNSKGRAKRLRRLLQTIIDSH